MLDFLGQTDLHYRARGQNACAIMCRGNIALTGRCVPPSVPSKWLGTEGLQTRVEALGPRLARMPWLHPSALGPLETWEPMHLVVRFPRARRRVRGYQDCLARGEG